MTRNQLGRQAQKVLAIGALTLPIVGAWAQGVPIEDEDLADVWGQAMFTVENRDATGAIPFDFTRITLNADVKLNANFSDINLGKVGASTADVSISDLRFVSSPGGVDGSGNAIVNNYVKITDPYIEFVYKNQGTANSEIVGMRFGFKGLDGNLGLKLNSIKGNLAFDQAADASDAYGRLTLNSAISATQFQCQTGCTTLGVDQVGHVRASGATDFFISMLNTGVADFGDGKSAQEGVSMNWTQGASYVNARGVILDNPLPALKIRQGG